MLAFVEIANSFRTADREAVRSAEFLIGSLRHQLEKGHPSVFLRSDSLQDFVEDVKRDDGYNIIVVDHAGNILGDVRKEDIGKRYSGDGHDEVSMTMKDGVPREFDEQMNGSHGAIKRTAVPLQTDDHKTVGAVLLDCTNIYDVARNKVLEVNAAITITVLISIICSIIFGSTLSKKLSDQVRKLEQGVHEIAQGNLDVTVDYGKDDELGVLAAEFNQMALDLRQSKKQLERQVSELKHGELLLQLATRATQDSIWEMDCRTKAVTRSQNFWKLFGYSTNDVELTFDFWKRQIHQEDVGRVLAGFELALNGGAKSWSDEYRLRRGDGSYADVLDRCYIEYDDVGSPVRAVGVLADISERKKAERALVEREGSLRLLFSNNPRPMFVYDLQTLQFLEVNDAVIESYGYSREEFFGMSILDIHPSDQIPQLRENLAEDRPSLQHSGEWKHRRKDGSVFDVEINSHVLEFMGERAVLVVAEDITKRKQAEEKLRESEVRFRSLIERSTDVISIIDVKGRIQYMSPSVSRMGYSMEEVIGKTAFDLVHPDDAQKMLDALKVIVSEPEILHTLEFRFRHRDGSWRDSESIVLNALNVPEIRGLVVNSRDITEKKKLEAQFLRAQRLESIGTLAGGIAHDLNNVLAPILLSFDMIRKSYADAKSQKMIDTIEVSAKRGADLVKQVLSFARGIEGERTVVQLRHLMSEVEKIILETFPRSISVITNVPRNLWTVSGDATQLHQVMMNLCVNARDAMPNGGKIEITAENVALDEQYVRTHLDVRKGPHVVLSFTDNGTGIPRHILHRIFEPFYTTKETGKGTGLGLSTVLTIVKSHGGFVNVYSEEGKGSTFKVYLPAQKATEHVEARKESMQMYRGSGELILIVDDEAAIREITKAALEAYGYQTIAAADGTEAVALFALRKNKIDLVITDMMMPYMDGVATIHALKKLDPKVKILAMSGLARGEGVAELKGVTSFLTKPYTSGKLLEAVHSALTES